MSNIEALLKFDPIDHAEKLAGASYKEDERKRKALAEAKDSHFGMEFRDFLSMAEAEGFTIIATREFTSSWTNDAGVPYNEVKYFMWNPEGFLLTVESYSEKSVNNAKLYYNLDFGASIPNNYHNFTSSGHFMRGPKDAEGYPTAAPVWVGDHDVREGFRHTLNKLRSVGTLPVWKEAPFLWFLTYMDTKNEDYDYKAINEEVIATFPIEVQKAIAGE